MPKDDQMDFSCEVCQPFYLEGSRDHGVLLIHGFTGSVSHMRPIGELLHARGFTVMGINLPGHATTMDDMAKCAWSDWLDASRDAFQTLKSRCTHVSVAGLSMGGCLTLIIGETMQPTAVAPISAPMGTRAPLWLATLASPFLKTICFQPKGDGQSLLDARYHYGYPGFRSSCAKHLARIIRMARQDLHALTCPLLVIQSHADETITADSAEIILNSASSQRKSVLWLEDVPHVVTITRETERIAAALAEHFIHAEQA